MINKLYKKGIVMENIFTTYKRKLFEEKKKKEVKNMLEDIKTGNNMKKVVISEMIKTFEEKGDVSF